MLDDKPPRITSLTARARRALTNGKSDPFATFTPRARTVLVLAQEEALHLGHPYLGTEHLLLGLLREGDGFGAHALNHPASVVLPHHHMGAIRSATASASPSQS